MFQQLAHGGVALSSRSAKLNRKNGKLVTVFLTLVLVMSGLVHSPAHAVENGFYACTTGVIVTNNDDPRYQIANNVAGGGQSCVGAVVIPIGVLSLSSNAFSGATALTSITLPATVTRIGASAFYGATSLTSITIPASVTYIGDAAFYGATSLASITMGAGVTSIGTNAFSGATALTSITLPASVTSIGAGAFSGATALATVTFAPGSNIDMSDAFSGATALTSITIPASFERIEERAFYGATALATVTFAAGSQLTSIGEDAFRGTALTSITIPANVTSIDGSAFQYATQLATVTFAAGSQLTSIGDYAFSGTALTSFSIPANVTSIGTYNAAFWSATLLSDITVDGANPNYSAADGVIFNKNSDTLIIRLNGRSGTSYTIPSTVTSVAPWAFQETALTSITIPASVTSIDEGAFSWTDALTTVTFETGSQLTSIGDYAFQGLGAITSITIPANVTSIGNEAFSDAPSLTSVYFLGNAPTAVNAFPDVANGAKAFVGFAATGFVVDADSKWNNLIVETGGYLVTYNTFGGSLVTAHRYDTDIATPTSPTRNGYTFAGWSLTDGGSVITFPHTPASAGDITLYARWTVAPTTATLKPTLTGTAKVGATLTARKGTWTGSPAPTFTYQWYACTQKVLSATQTVPGTCATINGATNTTFKLTSTHKGKYVTVKVTGTSVGTGPVSWLSASTSTKVLMRAAATTKPTLTGTAKVGKTLTVRKGTWAGSPAPRFTYQWYACTRKVSSATRTVPGTCKPIKGATQTTFTLTSAHKGKYITVKVTGTSSGTPKTLWLAKTTTKVT